MVTTVLFVCYLQLAFTVGDLFDKKYVGVIYTPYYEIPGPTIIWTLRQIEHQLEIVSTRFQQINTNAVGTFSVTDTWETGDPDGKVALAASNINKKLGCLHLTVNIGIQYKENADVQLREIANAFEAAAAANKNYPGTVVGISFRYYGLTGDKALRRVIEILETYADYKMRTNTSLKLNFVSDIHKNLDRLSGNLTKKAFDLVDSVAIYAYCDYKLHSSAAVEGTIDYFLEMAQRSKKIKSDIEVVGGTQCSSRRLCTGADDVIEDELLTDYWIGLGNWAAKEKFPMNFFSALDIPGRGKSRNCTRYSHTGWWTYFPRNNTFLEKYKNPTTQLNVESTKHSFLDVIMGATALTIFILFMIALKILCRRIVNERRVKSVKDSILEEIHPKSNPRRKQITINIKDALENTENYEIDEQKCSVDRRKVLGFGNYGIVYEGRLEGVSDKVAYKITGENSNASSLKSILCEIQVLKHVGKAPNVLCFYGACTKDIGKGVVIIALELCERGSLRGYLRNQKDTGEYCDMVIAHRTPIIRCSKQVYLDLIKWCKEIAAGMLHISRCGVIHGDLATRNVLLTADGTAKISDFGLSRQMNEYMEYVKNNQEPLPWRWMAPESLLSQTFSTQSDIWSYGIVLWEIFSLGDLPYPGLLWTSNFAIDLANGLRMSIPDLATEPIFERISKCWNTTPDTRPPFEDLLKFFVSVMQMENEHRIYRTTHAQKRTRCVWRSNQPLSINPKTLEPLGSGYFAQVFLAQSTTTGNTVAVKRIDLYKTLSCSNYQGLEDENEDSYVATRLEKLLRETENLSQINNENVIKLQRWWMEDPFGILIGVQELHSSLSCSSSALLSSGGHYFIFLQLEYCYGTMSTWMKEFKTVELRQKDESFGKMFLQIISGLGAIHSREIIHRDLKPDNIMYSLNGGLKTWKYGDLGLSTKLEVTAEDKQFISTAGAPNYKSPEMAKAQRYGTKTDVFSLGLTFLEVLHPFTKFMEKRQCFDHLRNSGMAKATFAGIKFELEDSNQPLIKLVNNMLNTEQEERWDVSQASKYLQDVIRSESD